MLRLKLRLMMVAISRIWEGRFSLTKDLEEVVGDDGWTHHHVTGRHIVIDLA